MKVKILFHYIDLEYAKKYYFNSKCDTEESIHPKVNKINSYKNHLNITPECECFAKILLAKSCKESVRTMQILNWLIAVLETSIFN